MSSDFVCPRCGLSLSSEDRRAWGEPEAGAEPLHPKSADWVPPEGSTFGREAASLALPDHDAGTAGPHEPPPAILGLDLGACLASPSTPLDAPDTPATVPGDSEARAIRSEESLDRDRDRDRDDEPDDRRSAWPIALLISYATAVSVACVWLWWTGHRNPSSPPPQWAAGLLADEAGIDGPTADSGRRADQSALVACPEPVPAHRRVGLGDSIRVDDLEISPLGVSIRPVELRRFRLDGRDERRGGGDDALWLRLRLRNVSDDAIFAPLDEAFVREPDRRLPDTFIESDSGDRIYTYRLPVASEWTIVGQEFPTLRPGESVEVVLVSDTDALRRVDGPMLWRALFRTSPETTAVVAIPFEADALRKRRPDQKKETPGVDDLREPSCQPT